ncbi:hypothetical protein ACFL6I_16855 [candidate division KSB1 bacterium]
MRDTIEVICSWCGKENTYDIKLRSETYRVKCGYCGRDFYIYGTEYGVVASPNKERAWEK